MILSIPIINKINLISDITEKKHLYEVWSDIQSYLPEELQVYQNVGYLTRTRIAFATSFSLNVKSNEGFDYDPVLFGKKELDQAEDNIEISEDKIVPPIIHDKFVENFNNLSNIPTEYR